jgi:hypothetical protein
MKNILTTTLLLIITNILLAQGSKTIAVLPFQAFVSGNMPRNLSQADVEQVKLNDGLYYQNEALQYLIRLNQKPKFAKKQIRMMNAETVNSLLLKNNLTADAAYLLSDDELHKILGVDYVVKGRTEKVYNLSDEATLALYTGTVILNRTSKNTIPIIAVPPRNQYRTAALNNVKKSSSVFASRKFMRMRRIPKLVLKSAGKDS